MSATIPPANDKALTELLARSHQVLHDAHQTLAQTRTDSTALEASVKRSADNHERPKAQRP